MRIFYLFVAMSMISSCGYQLRGSMNVDGLENIIIISNRKNLKKIKSIIKKKYKKFNIKILIQEKPLGMGDAVYIGLQKVITRFTATIWADQIYIENETIKKTINYFKKSKSLFTFPVFFKKK